MGAVSRSETAPKATPLCGSWPRGCVADGFIGSEAASVFTLHRSVLLRLATSLGALAPGPSKPLRTLASGTGFSDGWFVSRVAARRCGAALVTLNHPVTLA